VEFGTVFPAGAYAVGAFERVRDFEKSKGGAEVQQIDQRTGLPLWVIEVVDPQEGTRKLTVKVKVTAEVQPVLPPGGRVAVHPGRVRGPERHALRRLRPVQGRRQEQVRRPAGVLPQGHRRPRSGPGHAPAHR
jgi:hypothetical protein